jgi:hypothetical protein
MTMAFEVPVGEPIPQDQGEVTAPPVVDPGALVPWIRLR